MKITCNGEFLVRDDDLIKILRKEVEALWTGALGVSSYG